MATHYGGNYSSISEITGPSGFYNIKTAIGSCPVYVDQTYDGGGWACVLANRINTGGLGYLTYANAVNNCNYRYSTSAVGSSTVVDATSKLSGLENYNIFIGTSFWPYLAGRATSSKITVVQFVGGTAGIKLGNTSSHTKRYRWRFDNFNSTYGMVGSTALSDETGTGAPGFYTYHAANGFSLSTGDQDQDAYGSACSVSYGSQPWWYGACWDGNYFGGGNSGGHQDGPYWASSGGDYHNYGAVYIK